MEEIKNGLKHDYDLAVEAYNNGDYRSYFLHIRLCLELFPKLLIYDFLQDEQKSTNVIDGKIAIINDPTRGGYSISNFPPKTKPTGSYFATLCRSAYYLKHQSVEKHIRNAIDSLCSGLISLYSTASEIGAHTGETTLDDQVQAQFCMLFFKAQFDLLRNKNIISKEIADFLSTLNENSNATISTVQKVETDENSPANNWDVADENLDDEQIEIINQTTDKSMLVAGCAGSGKSIIVMHKAKLLVEQGQEVIIIAYTKSLSRYMGKYKMDAESNMNFYYYHEWLNFLERPTADYIIVDEIQDFTKEEIEEFIKATKKAYFFFGDTAQSIYGDKNRKTMTINEIAELTGLNPLHLYTNYRLPRPVAKITQTYLGIDVPVYKEKVYQSKETQLPAFVRCNTVEEEFENIVTIINKHSDKTIGILLPSNNIAREIYINIQPKLDSLAIEAKYSVENEKINEKIDSLSFYTNSPKVMTYHSAKGLQFDIVILPRYEGAKDEKSKKALYVAMTRTMTHLYLLYSTLTLMPPLNKVPPQLYLKKI